MAPRNARYIFDVLGSDGKPATRGMSGWIGLWSCLNAGRKCIELDGVRTKWLLSIGITLLLVPCIFAIDGEMLWAYFADNLLCTGSTVKSVPLNVLQYSN